ncbi:hypothetical protein LI99_05185 [Mycolicibacterium smegmatis]|jgi:hypothetical protein|uniref:Uncharacterized protein n=1 Tax=Mycolicibacterium smegmatis (strain ATCC 700084 / mc(2)155) TaxID=246196 RepID=A0QRA3_MYCS2|nr:hypothetical protein [Mycolicibacterium smegmatis]ABK70532.1 hypothetical protein MSMEG_1044 [Mycolicibacterium smegmatis MC2 155]ABK72188.1 hypothetical protein MSMEG_2324 [Mycolicibacterium smegmatis MC2 155]AIU06295.1 hypothetical protein LJ00_05185 [Mycolicibacterium smegmatis MC2 155]AIU12920.1 hypothetical protein LI99_05185 [Mycolicibacterium smegmatis]AIU19544.1 hypothetical protein LI98_05185 [Mycolicibacterium smegmatis]
MRKNWLSRLSVKYRRAYQPHPRTSARDADARRVHSELDAIRARFPDHA